MKLMSERRKIQVQLEDKRRKKKDLKMKKLEERERGFHVHFSGANSERIDEARRRDQRSQEDRRRLPPQMRGGNAENAGKEWQMATVELKGKDGQVFRTSPQLAGSFPQAMGKESQSDDGLEVATDD